MEAISRYLLQALLQTGTTFLHNWPFLLVSVLISAALKLYLDPQKVSAFLMRHRQAGVLGATAAAVATPLCSCGTTAVILGMLASTMPWAPIVAFMVASPLTSPEELVYSAGLFGWPFALAFFGASILLGLLGGVVAGILENRGWLANQSRFSQPAAAPARNLEPAVESCGCARPAEMTPVLASCACGVEMAMASSTAGGSISALPLPSRGSSRSSSGSPLPSSWFPLPSTSLAIQPNCGCDSGKLDQAQPTCGCSSTPTQTNPSEPEGEKPGNTTPGVNTPQVTTSRVTSSRVTTRVFLAEVIASGKRLLVMFAGFAFIGYLLNGLIPPAWVQAIFGGGSLYSVPLAATLGLPLYINTEGSLPLVRALIDSGMSQGAALAFLITGAGTSFGALAGALTIARWRVIAVVIGTLWAGAIVLGYLYNLLLATNLLS